MKKLKIKKWLLTTTAMLLLLPSVWFGNVEAAGNYLAITSTQTMDITYTIVQAQPGLKIVQARAGNNVVDGTNGWGAWKDITNASGSTIVGGLLVGNATIKSWSLPAGGVNSTTKVCIQMKDSSGNVTQWDANCGNVYWDTTAPVLNSLSLNNGVLWDNDWKLPLNISLSDPVGVSTSTGILFHENGGPANYLPGTNCVFNETTSKYDCLFNSVINATPGQASANYTVKYQDNLNNMSSTIAMSISFDEVAPFGSVSITQDASSSNLVNIVYSATDLPGIGGLSKIDKITVENVTTNPNNANLEVLYSALGNPLETVSGTKNCYTMNERLGTVKMTIYDTAGNATSVYSNTLTANKVGIDSTVINKVINPNKYPITAPYVPISINPGQQIADLPEAVAGGNVEVTQNFYWDTNVTDVTGFYQFMVSNSSGYVGYELHTFNLSNLVINGNTATLVMSTTIDKLAPRTVESDAAYISLQVEMYVTVNGVANKIPLYFPAKNTYYKVAEITGSIEDSINFEAK